MFSARLTIVKLMFYLQNNEIFNGVAEISLVSITLL